jgi:hypothetical protein
MDFCARRFSDSKTNHVCFRGLCFAQLTASPSSNVETLELRVVGNVQENSFGLSVLSGHVCQPSAWRTLSLPLFSPGGHAEVENHYGRHFFLFRRPIQAGHRDGFR